MNEEKLAVKPTRAAALLDVGRSKMYQLIADNVIPSIRIGGSLRVPVAALRRFIEEQTK